jgi:peptide/nickel transport system substrate-binding protein
MRSSLRGVRATALVVTLGLLGAACGGGNTADGSANAPSDATGSDAELDPNATLRLTYLSQPAQLDPHKERGRSERPYIYVAYDRLTDYDRENNLIPMLGTSWEFSDDLLSMTMELRDDVVFHDGTPFNADVVKANIERAKTLEGSTVASLLTSVESVEATDDDTVVFHLSAPTVNLPNSLALGAGVMISSAAIDDPTWDGSSDAGSGGWEITEFVPQTVVKYEKFDDYWNPDVQLVQRVEANALLDQNAVMNGMRTDQFDIGHPPDFLAGAEEAETSDLFDYEAIPRPIVLAMGMNLNQADFQDLRVRQALAHSIDRDLLVESLYGETCPVTNSFFDHTPFADPAFENPYPYDPDKARELLDEAGVDRVSFETLVSANTFHEQAATALQAELADIGFDMQISPIPGGATQVEFQEGDRDSIIYTFETGPDPISALATDITGGFNLANGDPEIAAIVDEAGAEPDEDAQLELLHQAENMIADQAWYIPICQSVTNLLYSSKVVGMDQMVGLLTFDPRGVGIRAE